MTVTLKATDTFQKNAKQLSKRYKSLKDDLLHLKESIEANPFQGADLGGGMRKIRMAIASKCKGRRGGARVITYNVIIEGDNVTVVLLTMYDKSDQESITNKELENIRLSAGL